jgi:ribosomal protein S18 acetylase RimI-like enzyme
MGIILRDFKSEDYDKIDHFWNETGLGNPQRGDNKEVIERTITQGGRLILLEDTDKQIIIGTSWLTNDGRRMFMHHFGISDDYQGKGLSQQLMVESLKYAKEKKLQIKLEVHKASLNAIKLYEKSGFNYLGDYLVYIIRNIDEIKS